MERYDKKTHFQIAFNDFTFDRSEYNKEAKQPFSSTEQMKSNIKSIFIKIPLEVLLTPLLKIYAKIGEKPWSSGKGVGLTDSQPRGRRFNSHHILDGCKHC